MPFCIHCGLPVAANGGRCSFCGQPSSSSAAPVAGAASRSDESVRNRTVLGLVALAVAICAAILIAGLLEMRKVEDRRPTEGPLRGSTESLHTPRRLGAAPKPLQFRTSGRLPTTVQGLALGMETDKVLARYPDIKTTDGKEVDANRGGALTLHRPDRLPDEMSIVVILHEDRLTYIDINKWGLSWDDAAEFQRNTLAHLGAPDVVVSEGDDETALVWLDGDIRVRFRNSQAAKCPTRRRQVELELVVWPAELAAVSSAPSASWFLNEHRTHWGDAPATSPGPSPLPRELGSVRLRMAPWEVRAAAPGIRLVEWSANKLQGELNYADGSQLAVHLWNHRVSRIALARRPIPDAEALASERQRLESNYGTPRLKLGFQGPEWRDESVKFSVVFMTGAPKLSATYWLVDLELDREEAEFECSESPPELKPGPVVKSFFNR